MRLDEVISSPKLYHGTSLEGLVRIVAQNRMIPSSVDAATPGVSFTRDFRVARDKAENLHRNAVKGAVIEFDRDLLTRRFGRRLKPVDVLGIRGAEAFSASEAEERIQGEATGIVPAITAIYLFDLSAYEAYRERSPRFASAFERIQPLIVTGRI